MLSQVQTARPEQAADDLTVEILYDDATIVTAWAHSNGHEQRGVVALFVGCGMPRDRIASWLRISEATLERHFRDQLLNGRTPRSRASRPTNSTTMI